MDKAIKKALEGGWRLGWRYEHSDYSFVYVRYVDTPYKQPIVSWPKEKILFDPHFWECLGKACDWKNEKVSFEVSKKEVRTYKGSFIRPAHTVVRPRWKKNSKPWLKHWHECVEHVANGGSIETFFQTLNI